MMPKVSSPPSNLHELASLMLLENSFENRMWFLILIDRLGLYIILLQEREDLCLVSPPDTEPWIVNELSGPL